MFLKYDSEIHIMAKQVYIIIHRPRCSVKKSMKSWKAREGHILWGVWKWWEKGGEEGNLKEG